MLGLTDNQNQYGALPPIIARGLGRSAGALLADYAASLFNNRRSSRAILENIPPAPGNIFHGGERASKSPFADILSDYVKAERQGMEHGECFPYFKKCPKSLFLPSNNNPYVMNESEHSVDEEVEGEDLEEISTLYFSKNVLESKNAT